MEEERKGLDNNHTGRQEKERRNGSWQRERVYKEDFNRIGCDGQSGRQGGRKRERKSGRGAGAASGGE